MKLLGEIIKLFAKIFGKLKRYFIKDLVKSLYKNYVSKCKIAKIEPQDKKEFEIVHQAVRKNISAIKNKYNKPMCAMEIDDLFIYYAVLEKNEDRVIVNIWTKEQYYMLTKKGV